MYWLFISVFLYASNNILWKIFIKEEQPLRLINRRAVFTVLIAFTAIWVTQFDIMTYIQNPKAVYVFLGSLFGVAGLVLMVTFLKKGGLVRMGYYSLMGTFIAAAYTYLFKEVPFSNKTLIGAILIITGYMVFLLNEKRQAKSESALFSQHMLLIGMTICFAISLLIQWECLKIFPPIAIIATQEVTVLTVTFIALMLLNVNAPNQVKGIVTIRNTAFMAIVIFVAIFTGTLGLKTADPFLASITGISVPVLTVFGGSMMFKDKLNILYVISLVLMILGGLELL